MEADGCPVRADSPQSLESATRAVHGLKRIGEILVDAKAITERTRDNMLAFSKANRVTFGTAILESGALPEQLLLRALSVQTSSPPASARDLASISPGVLRLVPGKLAQKYSVLPFRKVGRTLYLAMARPWDQRPAAEIEFLTGLTVIRHVAVVARLVVALEKHYGILASPRHKALAAKLGEPAEGSSQATNTPSESRGEQPPALAAISSPSREPPAKAPLDPWDALPDFAEPTEDAVLLETVEAVELVPGTIDLGAAHPVAAVPTPTAGIGPSDLRDQLGRAENRDEIGSAILSSMNASLRVGALFAVDGERVSGWMARPEPPRPLPEFSLELSEPSLFSSLRNTVGFFAGLCPDTGANRRILESSGVPFPAVIGVVPVTTCGNTEFYLLGQAVEGEEALTIPQLKKHAAMSAIALEILALRVRLRETGAAIRSDAELSE